MLLLLGPRSCQTLCDPWAAACQAPLFMEFSRQDYWSGLPRPPPGILPDPGIESASPAWQAILTMINMVRAND